MKKKISALLCLTLAAGLLMTGCSGNGEDTSSAVSELSQPQTDLTIGREQEDAYQVAMDNQIGQDITAVAVKLTTEESYPADLMEDGQTWSDGETALVCYLPGEAAASQDEEDGIAVKDTYEMQLTLEDGSTIQLTTVPFEDMDACTLYLEDDVPYLEYTSLSSQEEVSTKETESAAIALAQQQAQEAAAAQAAAEAEAQRQAQEAAAAQAAAEAEAQRQAQEAAAAQAEAQRQAQEAAAAQAAAEEEQRQQQLAAQQAAQQQAQQEAAAQQQQGQQQQEEGCLAGAI